MCIRDSGIIDAILDHSIDAAPTKTIPFFNFVVPTQLEGVDPKILRSEEHTSELQSRDSISYAGTPRTLSLIHI